MEYACYGKGGGMEQPPYLPPMMVSPKGQLQCQRRRDYDPCFTVALELWILTICESTQYLHSLRFVITSGIVKVSY